jgi:hypothetical protein
MSDWQTLWHNPDWWNFIGWWVIYGAYRFGRWVQKNERE